MSVVNASNLSKYYGPQDVFEDLSFDIPPDSRIALVGPNGSGKSTLLRLIAGLDHPDDGQVHRARGLRIGYLPQQARLEGEGTLWESMEAVFADLQAQARHLRQLEEAMADMSLATEAMERYGPLLEAFERAGGYTYPARIEQVLSGLGFHPDEFHFPISYLSGGQRTRALLARLLLENPDLLLLDEPTNHLDLQGIEWLEGYLTSWEGTMVVVAHDRAFLDQVVEHVWELSFGRLESYPGNYSQYVTLRKERRARRQELYERQQEEITRTEDYIRRYMAGQRTRQAQGRKKRLERVERLERPQELQTLHLDLGEPLRSGDLVLGLYDLAVGYEPQAPLFTTGELELRRGERLALLGPNGSGKTTLLRTILGELPPLAGRIRIGAGVRPGYFAQAHAGLDRQKTVLDTIVDAGLPSIGRARDLLGQYRFSGDDVFKRVGDLSGGEQTRVALALLAMQGANLLLMDEPTNHLDIPSQEVLQEVLVSFPGTIMLVAHDRYLIRALATRIWAIAGDRLRDFRRGYDAYRAWMQQQEEQFSAEQERDRTAREQWEAERAARRAAERELERREQERVEIEETVHRLEARLEALETEVAQASEAQEVERVTELGLEYAQVEQELDTALERWEALT